MTVQSLKIAIISDLHVGDIARGRDFRTTNIDNAIDKDYKDTFIKFVKSKGLTADFLIIPGDITNKAKPDEFVLASEIISDISKALNVKQNKIIFVPGNHDADWTGMISDPDDRSGIRRQQRYTPIRNSSCIFEKISKRSKRNMFDHPDFSYWEFKDLQVVGYNSSWHDGPDYKIHHGLAKEESLQEIDKYLQGLNFAPNQARLFLVHHHPLQYSDPIPEEPDFSAMTNAENLIKLLNKYRFDFLIHGHKHAPHFTPQVSISGYPLIILGAGSFSAIIDNRWNGLISNQFHIINIDGRDSTQSYVYGNVENWSYVCGGKWLPSQKYNGIDHKLPFGLYIDPSEIKKVLLPVITATLRKKGHVDWADILSINSAFSYVPIERISQAIADLSGDLNIRCVGNLPDGGVIIMRR